MDGYKDLETDWFLKKPIDLEHKQYVLNAEQEDNFLFKGIANRAFTRTFALEDQIEVKNAEMFNGMLQVFLERIIPEHKKPKKIEVKEAGAKKQKVKPMGELLLEEDERNL